MKHRFENTKNIYYTTKVISTNKNTFSIFSKSSWLLNDGSNQIYSSQQASIIYIAVMPCSKFQIHQEGPIVQYQGHWISKAFIIFFSPSYAFLNCNTRKKFNA